MTHQLNLSTPSGHLLLTEEDGTITAIRWTSDIPSADTPSALLQQAAEQITGYFHGRIRQFSLPLRPSGTPFQQQVWKALQAIPYGQTRTYAQIAASIGRPHAVRAVGGACHRNPIAVVIPCHRVIGSNGTLTGYAGGTDTKRFLLQCEQAYTPIPLFSTPAGNKF